ncbi:MAG: hypothetical protein KatS3mg106_400 [Gemmataceae bacterium]|nr:MAG: hypothetical protein KatS3mg106_400 [Gemmataceae bacterium]
MVPTDLKIDQVRLAVPAHDDVFPLVQVDISDAAAMHLSQRVPQLCEEVRTLGVHLYPKVGRECTPAQWRGVWDVPSSAVTAGSSRGTTGKSASRASSWRSRWAIHTPNQCIGRPQTGATRWNLHTARGGAPSSPPLYKAVAAHESCLNTSWRSVAAGCQFGRSEEGPVVPGHEIKRGGDG